MATFLHIGSFNVVSETVIRAVSKFGVESNLKHLSLLCDRTIVSKWSVNGGTPKGRLLSPLLWIMVASDLLGKDLF